MTLAHPRYGVRGPMSQGTGGEHRKAEAVHNDQHRGLQGGGVITRSSFISPQPAPRIFVVRGRPPIGRPRGATQAYRGTLGPPGYVSATLLMRKRLRGMRKCQPQRVSTLECS